MRFFIITNGGGKPDQRNYIALTVTPTYLHFDENKKYIHFFIK